MATPRRLRMSTLFQTRDGIPSNKDAKLTNCLIEKNGDELDVIKRPGYILSTTPASGIGAGATSITDAQGQQQIISAINTTVYTTQNMVATAWVATGGTTDFGSSNTNPSAVFYFNKLFWILNPAITGGSSASNAVYSSSDAITWTQVNASAAYNIGGFTRTQFGSCVFGGKMWVMGGVVNGVNKHDVWSSADGVTWLMATSAAAWSARLGPSVIVYNSMMWVIGSRSGGGSFQEVYSSPDGINWTQTTAAAPWNATTGPAVYTFANKMWYAGGITGGTLYNALYSSTDGITWTSVGNAQWTPRFSMQTFVLNNRIYVATGRDGGSTYTKDLWSSPDGITWTQATADMGICGVNGAAGPGPALAQSTFVVGNSTVYVFGQLLSTPAYDSTIYKASVTTTTTTTANITSGATSVPSVVPTPGPIVDWSSTLDGTHVAIKNTAAAWNYTIAGQSMVQVTNVNYPPITTRGLVYLDGTFYVMDPYGQIWGSAINDFSTWTALNVINAQGEPDGGVCLTKYGQYVVAFGQYTTEYFFDAGNATGSPLSSVQNAMQLVGCACADSVIQAESSVFWIAQAKAHGQTFNPQRFVARLDGMSYTIMSTPNIDRILNADSLVGAWGVYCKVLGHPVYIISLPQTGVSIAYDIKIGLWYVWTTGTAQSAQAISAGNMTYTLQTDGKALVSVTLNSHGFADSDPITIAAATQTAYNGTWNVRYVDANTFTYVATAVPAATPATGSPTAQGTTQGVFPLLQAFNYNGLQLFQHYATGAIYQISDTTYSDNSVFIDTKGRFERFDSGLSQDGNSQNKFAGWIDAVTDRAATTLFLRWSDDDYQTYSHYRSVDLSFARSRLHRCGAFLRRAFEIRHTDKVAMRFQGIDVGLEQGSE